MVEKDEAIRFMESLAKAGGKHFADCWDVLKPFVLDQKTNSITIDRITTILDNPLTSAETKVSLINIIVGQQ